MRVDVAVEPWAYGRRVNHFWSLGSRSFPHQTRQVRPHSSERADIGVRRSFSSWGNRGEHHGDKDRRHFATANIIEQLRSTPGQFWQPSLAMTITHPGKGHDSKCLVVSSLDFFVMTVASQDRTRGRGPFLPLMFLSCPFLPSPGGRALSPFWLC